jgi:hypothetical protein
MVFCLPLCVSLRSKLTVEKRAGGRQIFGWMRLPHMPVVAPRNPTPDHLFCFLQPDFGSDTTPAFRAELLAD